MDPETRELTPRLLPLAPEARARLIDFANEVELRQAPGRDLAEITDTASKAAKQAARIAGVLALFADLNAPAVRLEDVADAVELMRYYLAEALRLSRSAEVDRAERLRLWLMDTWPHAEITLREAQNKGPLRESPQLRAALAMLVKTGWLVPLRPGTPIRGATRKEAWRIVRDGGGG